MLQSARERVGDFFVILNFAPACSGSRGAMRNSWAGEGSPAMTPEAEVRCPAADFLAARDATPVVMGEKYRHSRLW